MTPRIFDQRLVIARRQRAAALGAATFLLDRAAEDLGDRLASVVRRFERAAVLFAPTGVLRQAVLRAHPAASILSLHDALDAAQADVRLALGAFVAVGDPERLPLKEESFDLVVSALALQTVNDLPGALIQMRRALRPDGLCLAALFGGDTLTELRQSFAEAEIACEGGLSPRVAPFVDVRDLGTLLQRAGFALPVTDVDRVVVRYASPFALMDDLRRMGAANPLCERRRTSLRRQTLLRMAQIYAERFADPDGRVRATFDIVWLSGWAPHESQQKPLRPGSAQVWLADALGAREISTGEKAGG